MEKFFQFLHSFHAVSPALKDQLQHIIQYRTVPRKSFLLKAGHVCRQICFVEEGLLRAYYIRKNMEVCSRFMREGDMVLNMCSFFRQEPSSECIQALEDCTLLSIEYKDLQRLSRCFPELNEFTRSLTELYFIKSEELLHALRLQRSDERYAFLMREFPYLIQRVPSKYLASYIGVTDVTLSNVRSRI